MSAPGSRAPADEQAIFSKIQALEDLCAQSEAAGLDTVMLARMAGAVSFPFRGELLCINVRREKVYRVKIKSVRAFCAYIRKTNTVAFELLTLEPHGRSNVDP